MTDKPDLWTRLKEVRVVRVLVVYLGASWVVLQVASTIVQAFKLDDWVLPTAIILLLIGLVIIVATAWVQSLASTTAGEASGELPTDWQIAPRDAIESLRRGRLPHLTWGRAVTGGVLTLLLLFAGAGSYAGLTRMRLVGPSPASASEAATGIAIVPFDVRGTGLDIWREGMMDLLSNGLDGVGGFRTIDSRTVLARWHDVVGDKTADLAAILAVAKETGARYAMEGSVIALGPSVRLVTTVYDIETKKEVARASVEGPAADVLRLVDELAVGTMRELLKSIGRAYAADESAETITTKSLSAMRAYLAGEAYYRKGDFAKAVQSYEEAVAKDSTFAIALVELSETYGWLENDNSVRMVEVGKRAFAQTHRLSPRYQFIMTGWDALNRHSPDGVPSLKEAVRKYPDDARAWFLLAETYIHVGGSTYGTLDDIWEAVHRASTLDPSFAPYLVHVAEIAILRGDSVAARQAIDKYVKLTGGRTGLSHIELAIPLILGTEEQAAAALKSAPGLPVNTLDAYAAFAQHNNRFDRDAAIDAALAAGLHVNRTQMQAYYAAAQGDVARGSTIANDSAVSVGSRTSFYAFVFDVWGVQPPPGILVPAACPPANLGCGILAGRAFAGMGRWADHQAVIANLRNASAASKDTVEARKLLIASELVRGIGLHRRGNIDAARQLITKSAQEYGMIGDHSRYELAMIEAESRRPNEALRYFNSIRDSFLRPIALYGAASIHEELGQTKEAGADWAAFLTLTAKADALPRIASARAAFARLQPKD